MDDVKKTDDDLAVAEPAAVATPTFTTTLVRASDQIKLDFEFLDLELVDDELQASGANPAIRVVFGSQHTAEEVVEPSDTASEHRSAAPSRMVFSVTPPLPFSMDTLLDFAQWTLVTPTSNVPADTETALELPQAMVMAPSPGAQLQTPTEPRVSGSVSELWTAQLTGPSEVTVIDNLEPNSDPFTSRSPNASERSELVTLTTTVSPAEARQLWLSLHGAFLDVHGDWTEAAAGTNLSRWMQRVIAGRDIHIEVSNRGFLAPFGHAAVMTTVTERKLTAMPEPSDEAVATLVQQTYLTVTEPTLIFPRYAMPSEGRGLPFQEVSVAEASWIPVEKQTIEWTDDDGTPRTIRDSNAWNVVQSDGRDLMLCFVATDSESNEPVSFELPVSFVEYENAFGTFAGGNTPSQNLADYYAASETIARREVDLDGGTVAWAVPATPGSGQTTKATRVVRFTVDALNINDDDGVSSEELRNAGQPNIFPRVELATVIDETIASTQGEILEPIEVSLHQRWLDHGNEAENFDQAFLTIKEPETFPLGAEGRAALSVDLVAEVFNQTSGAGPDRNAVDDPWDPVDMFGDASKLLGSIPLAEVLKDIAGDAIAGIDIPGVETVYANDKITATFSYSPTLKSAKGLGFLASDDSEASIVIESCVTLDGITPPRASTEVTLSDIGLEIPPLLPAVELQFSRVRVFIPTDGPLDLDFDIEEWKLRELLAWLQPLIDILANAGVEPNVDISDEALDVELSVAPPNIALGVLTISNFNLFAGAGLSLEGAPATVAANVGQPHQPVEISLVGFDGSFYMLMEAGGEPAALQLLAVSAEASVQLFGIDILVAEVTIHLGISGCFMIETDEVTFGGCIFLEGVIDVLGLISVAAGIVGSLSYEVNDKDLIARGTITYSVDTFLTKPKEGAIPLGQLTYSLGESADKARALAATASGGLSFADRFSAADWQDYTGAFA